MNKEAIKWLRAEIESGLTAARGLAVYGTGQWAVAQNSDFNYSVHDHCDAAIPQQQPIADTWREDAAHWIARHDPQDVIARGEAELAILRLYTDTAAVVADCTDRLRAAWGAPADAVPTAIANRDYIDGGRELAVLAEVVKTVASGYRHRDGYTQHWGEA